MAELVLMPAPGDIPKGTGLVEALRGTAVEWFGPVACPFHRGEMEEKAAVLDQWYDPTCPGCTATAAATAAHVKAAGASFNLFVVGVPQ